MSIYDNILIQLEIFKNYLIIYQVKYTTFYIEILKFIAIQSIEMKYLNNILISIKKIVEFFG